MKTLTVESHVDEARPSNCPLVLGCNSAAHIPLFTSIFILYTFIMWVADLRRIRDVRARSGLGSVNTYMYEI